MSNMKDFFRGLPGKVINHLTGRSWSGKTLDDSAKLDAEKNEFPKSAGTRLFVFTCRSCQKGSWEVSVDSRGMTWMQCPHCKCLHSISRTLHKCYKCAKTYDLISVSYLKSYVQDHFPNMCPYCGAPAVEPCGPCSTPY